MMVMSTPCNLVAGTFPWYCDRRNVTRFQKCFQVAIDGGNANNSSLIPGGIQYLLRRQRSLGNQHSLPYSVALSSIAFGRLHGISVHGLEHGVCVYNATCGLAEK